MAESQRPRVYLAGPLFTQAERRWNESLATALEAAGIEVLLPQKMAGELIEKMGTVDEHAICAMAVEAVSGADMVLAVLDGADVDSGTAFECGVAFTREIPIVGLRTDFRKGGDGSSNVNLMLSASCHQIVYLDSLTETSISETVERLLPVIAENL